jgi:hypothetical protein
VNGVLMPWVLHTTYEYYKGAAFGAYNASLWAIDKLTKDDEAKLTSVDNRTNKIDF